MWDLSVPEMFELTFEQGEIVCIYSVGLEKAKSQHRLRIKGTDKRFDKQTFTAQARHCRTVTKEEHNQHVSAF